MIRGMGGASRSGQMDRGMMDIGKMIWQMAKVGLSMKTVNFTKDIGLMI